MDVSDLYEYFEQWFEENGPVIGFYLLFVFSYVGDGCFKLVEALFGFVVLFEDL